VKVDAIVDLGPLGSLDIEQETKIKLEFDGIAFRAREAPQDHRNPLFRNAASR